MASDFPRPPTTVPRRDPAPEAKPLSETLKLGPNSKDATSAKSGTSFALVGAEAALIALLEKSRGRPLTEPEIHLSLEQAKALGELP